MQLRLRETDRFDQVLRQPPQGFHTIFQLWCRISFLGIGRDSRVRRGNI